MSLRVLCLFLTGCGLFDPRTPEPPLGNGGTFLQPDTPDRVVQNLQAAIAELNTQNYLRSLASPLAFDPTVAAEAEDPLVWANWGRPEEDAYFSRLAAAARPFSGHSLQFFNERITPAPDRYTLEAQYLLTVRHSRADEGIPTQVQGRLVWVITPTNDGLWALSSWTDQAIGGQPSWSTLKAAFVK